MLERFFTTAGVDPYSQVEWDMRSAVISGEDGRVVFEQKDVEVPRAWSQTATNVVVSKYFRGPLGTPRRETSVRQLISRVVDTIAGWGDKQGYFADADARETFHAELTYLLLNQKASFNSPVYFNVGIEAKPQCSACFILKVDDSMDSILSWYRNEGMIFKGGSGAGVNLSALRSCREKLSSGGTASGPLSFMKAADASAGVIKSGGKTRRAAKMVVLNADHPDIVDFIKCKVEEERKAWALIEAGYDSSLDGPAYGSVFFQNANNSVRATDGFMQAVLDDAEWQTHFVKSSEVAETRPARKVLQMIAEAAHACGDPGMQFDTTINLWHTCPASGRINASNPCSEYMHLDNSACNLASLNLMKFIDDRGEFDVRAFRHAVDVMITAQDIVVDNSSYPTDEIAKNASAFRELGLGYANLGALLMALGMPYDSDQGRSYAAAITALMTGEAYLQSARIAEQMGPFAGYAPNREPMLKVIERHKAAAYKLDPSYVPLDLLRAARDSWDDALQGRHRRRLPQLAGHGDRADRHDRVHDGLRHHRHRARHRADQVQEAGRRRDAENRQRHGAARAQAAGLRLEGSAGNRRVPRRERDDRRRAATRRRASRGFRLRFQAARRRSHDSLQRPHQDDGRGAAVHLGRDFQDHQHARGSDGGRSGRGLRHRVEARAQGGRDLPRRLQAHAAAQHRRRTRERRWRRSQRRRSRRPTIGCSGASCPTSANRSRTNSISPATKATSRSACTRTARRARFSSRCPSRARPSRA